MRSMKRRELMHNIKSTLDSVKETGEPVEVDGVLLIRKAEADPIERIRKERGFINEPFKPSSGILNLEAVEWDGDIDELLDDVKGDW